MPGGSFTWALMGLLWGWETAAHSRARHALRGGNGSPRTHRVYGGGGGGLLALEFKTML